MNVLKMVASMIKSSDFDIKDGAIFELDDPHLTLVGGGVGIVVVEAPPPEPPKQGG